MVTVPAMQEHAERLCQRHQIVWQVWQRTRRAYAFNEVQEINTPPIRGAVSYGVVMRTRSAIFSGDTNTAAARYYYARCEWAG
jgi:hypothetical protein